MTYNTNLAFKALADPTRRLILERLTSRPMTVRQINDGLTMSQPAVSQHLDLLKKAGLVRVEPSGASNVYRVDPAGLAVIRTWLDQHWSEALLKYQALFDDKKD